MKKGLNKGVGLAVIFIAVFLGFIIMMINMLRMSNNLREFKVDLYVLCYESKICVGEGSEGKYRIDKENLIALNAMLSSTYGSFTYDDPEKTESIKLDFKHEDGDFELTISRVGENKLCVELEGPRSYKVYVKDNKKFEEMQKVVSKRGYNVPNKPIG